MVCLSRRALVGAALVVCGLSAGGVLRAQAGASQVPTYAVADSTVVGHVVGRWYDIDVVNRRLYGAGGAIIDIDQNRIIGHIADSTPGTEYLVAAEDERGLTNTGVVFNPTTGAVGEHMPVHGDAIAYDPATRRALLLSDTVQIVNLAPSIPMMPVMQRRRGGMGGMGTAPTAINSKRDTVIRRLPAVRLTATIVGEIALPAAAAGGALDRRGFVYLTVPSRDSVLKFDAEKMKVVSGRPVPSCKQPTAVSIDNVHDRLFLGCDSAVVVMSLTDGHISGQLATSGHPREMAFDAGAGLLFVPEGGQGVLVIHEQDPEHYVIAQTISDPRVVGATALVLDPTTHRVSIPHTDPDGTLRFAIIEPQF